MHADSIKYLWDAREAAQRVQRFIGTHSFADYQANELLRSGVERQLEIVGEAMSQLRRVDHVTFDLLPEANRVVGFRNVLAHGYASVDNKIVWGVVISHLAPLIAALDKLLADS